MGAQWDAKGTFNLGFHQEGSPDVMQALSCPLAHDAIAKAPKALRGALRYLQGSDDLGIFRVGVRTSVRTRETEIALWTRPSGFPRAACRQDAQKLAQGHQRGARHRRPGQGAQDQGP